MASKKNSFVQEAELEEEIVELRKALKTAHRAEARAKNKTADLVEAVYRAAADAQLASPRLKILPGKKDVRKGKAEVALVHLTDWQAGKKSISFGMQTLSERIELMINKVIHLTEIQRTHHPVRECVVLLGGDMVEGIGIFPGQVYEVEAHLFEQLFEVVRIIEQAVVTLAQNFESVKVVCEFGNHGRLGRKGDMPSGDNIDRMAYKIASERCSLIKNISWQMSGDWHQIFHIGNYKALLVHGDEVNSFGGNVPAFGILRKCNAWATGVVDEFQDVYMGHFHTPMTLTMANAGRVFVSGSPESHNEYARVFIAAVGRPSQRLHFVDPVKGMVTAEYTIWLD
jgi:hypothetical protein